MALHSSTLAWKIPWTEEPGRLTVHGVAQSWTRLSDFTFTFHFHALEKEMATHSSVLAWRIPGTAEPGGLPSMGTHRVGHDWRDLAAIVGYRRRQWQPTPVLLPGKSHGWRRLVGCSPWGREVRHDWVTSLSLFTFMHWRRKWQPTPVFLPGESQGLQSLVGCRLWGHTQSDTTEVT